MKGRFVPEQIRAALQNEQVIKPRLLHNGDYRPDRETSLNGHIRHAWNPFTKQDTIGRQILGNYLAAHLTFEKDCFWLAMMLCDGHK